MQMSDDIGIIEANTEIRYGCIFCLTGHESSVAESLEAQTPGLIATSVSQTKVKSVQGVSSVVNELIFPGYVYFQTKSQNPPDLRYIEDSIRLLETTKNSWTLTGMDAWFAKWIIDHHGVIGMSKAVRIDKWVEIISGPLHELKPYIRIVDKHRRRGLVVLPFHNREVRIWLKYELE